MTLLYSNFSKVDSGCYDDLKWAKLPTPVQNNIMDRFGDKFCDGPGGADSAFTIKCKEKDRPEYCNTSYRKITNINPQIQPSVDPINIQPTPINIQLTPINNPSPVESTKPVESTNPVQSTQPAESTDTVQNTENSTTENNTTENNTTENNTTENNTNEDDEITYTKISSFNSTKSNFGKKNNSFQIILIILLVLLLILLKK